ncbi:GMC family oxidoreductase [Nocardia higoensis]|uniref:Cholesterol oxidase n=1 Tax=Nocardia higoensis TaxID=228599 RepID=A0ABS0DGW1_9NOCA|nr:GMC oxidoreductase [Nocardia higoensis]MBF6357705.1 GMC family oxidoreductase [Nocardia higoensis]
MTRSSSWDAIVVGSGFGGAVTAARLAERGLKVLILERGAWRDGAPDGAPTRARGAAHLVRGVRWSAGTRSASATIRSSGLYELHQFAHLTCVVASGVGGGSLVYTDMQVPPHDDYFRALPADITAAEMRPHFEAVRTMLSPKPVAHVPHRVRAFERALATAGLGAAHFPDLAATFEQPGSPVRSTMAHTYIPSALRHGATLRPMSEATAIDHRPTGWRVRYHDHIRHRSCVESAPRLILSAGTLGTMRLLFAARDRHKTLPMLSPALGRGFTPNADMVSIVHRTATRIDGDDGPPVAAYHTEAVDGREFLTGEVGIGLLTPSAAVTRLFPRTALLIGMGADRIAVETTYDGHNLHIDADRTDDPEIFDRIGEHARRIAGGYRAKRSLINAPFGATSRRLTSVHPLGGVRVADTPADGVVDHTGQVHRYPGLFVADGSILPGAPGVPPSMTIAALAERQSAFIANS